MGPKKPKGVRRPGAQRDFVNEAWLSGMTIGDCKRHIQRFYGKDAATSYVNMLWQLRADQMSIFEGVPKPW